MGMASYEDSTIIKIPVKVSFWFISRCFGGAALIYVCATNSTNWFIVRIIVNTFTALAHLRLLVIFGSQ